MQETECKHNLIFIYQASIVFYLLVIKQIHYNGGKIFGRNKETKL